MPNELDLTRAHRPRPAARRPSSSRSTRCRRIASRRWGAPAVPRRASTCSRRSRRSSPNAFATDIPTQPSHTAVFTGSYGASTGIISHFHPPAQLRRAGALAALAPARRRMPDRCRRSPVRDEGVVRARLRGLHGPSGTVALAGFRRQRARVPLADRQRRRRLLPVPALLGRAHSLRPGRTISQPLHVGVAVAGSIRT